MKKRTLILRECETKIVRVHVLKPGKTIFATAGEWMLRTMAEVERRCAKKSKKPCIHLEAKMLTPVEVETMNRIEWHADLEEITRNVERNQRGPA